jgi:hypothetical protein
MGGNHHTFPSLSYSLGKPVSIACGLILSTFCLCPCPSCSPYYVFVLVKTSRLLFRLTVGLKTPHGEIRKGAPKKKVLKTKIGLIFTHNFRSERILIINNCPRPWRIPCRTTRSYPRTAIPHDRFRPAVTDRPPLLYLLTVTDIPVTAVSMAAG